jgi:hypothetical protein
MRFKVFVPRGDGWKLKPNVSREAGVRWGLIARLSGGARTETMRE